MSTTAEFMDVRRARYDSMLRTIDWRTFAHRMKEAANFSCAHCRQGGNGVELNVHHHAYDAERVPWDYKSDEVIVLCKRCHREMHEALQSFRRHLFSRMTARGMEVMIGAMRAGIDTHGEMVACHALAILMSSPRSVERFAKASAKQDEATTKT